MSVLANTLSGIFGRAQNARQAVWSLACKIVEGGRVSAAEIDRVRMAADMTAVEFAALVERLERRKKASDAYHSRDFGAEISEVRHEYAEVNEQLQVDKDACNELQKRIREGHERARGLHHRSNSLVAEQAQAKREFQETMAATGGGADWEDCFHDLGD